MQGGIDGIVENLRIACGFGKSESQTEAFLYALGAAVDATMDDCEKSHEDGLCWDCQSGLSGHLREMLGKS